MCHATLFGLSSSSSAKVLTRWPGGGDIPPQHLGLHGFGQAPDSSAKGSRAEWGEGLRRQERRVYGDVGPDSDPEEPRPRLALAP